jgi:hypothetical protein
LHDLESWNKSTQLPLAVEHGSERFYRRGSADDGTAPGLVPAGVVGADCNSSGPAMDDKEAESVSDQSAIQPGGQSEAAAVLGMMATACSRLASVEGKLGSVPLMKRDLESLVKGQEKMETTVERIEEAQRNAQTQFERQFQLQQLQIQETRIRLESYEATAKKVEDLEKLYGELDKKVFAYALLAAVVGAVVSTLFSGLPAWLERHPLQKASFIMSSALVRLQ